MNSLLYAVLGLVAGIFSGLFGIGGAIILVPAMVYLFKMTQHQAQGTALAALLPPVGLLAVLRYWQAGNVKVALALFICLGFFIGGLIGANVAQAIPQAFLKKLFGGILFVLSLYMLIGK